MNILYIEVKLGADADLKRFMYYYQSFPGIWFVFVIPFFLCILFFLYAWLFEYT